MLKVLGCLTVLLLVAPLRHDSPWATRDAPPAITAAQAPASPPFRPAVAAGPLLYLSGALATGADGKIVSGDVKAQTRQVLENLRSVLQANGSQMEKVASVTVYLKRAADFQAMNEVYRTYWPSEPPARTTIMANLVAPDALLEISMIAVTGGGERRVVHPADWAKSPNPYSYGVQAGDTLFTAGLVARNGKDNTTVAGDITAQTHAVMKNAADILKAAGMDFANVVSARVFLADVAMFEQMNAAYRSYFPKDPPARATVRAGLTSPDYLVEMAFTAVKASDRQAFTTPNADGTAGTPNPNLSSAIKVGRRLYMSGMLGNTDANRQDLRGQTRETLARIERTARTAGFNLSDIVESTVYLTDAAGAAPMNEAYRPLFGNNFPARATTEVGLASPTALVEIMTTAWRK